MSRWRRRFEDRGQAGAAGFARRWDRRGERKRLARVSIVLALPCDWGIARCRHKSLRVGCPINVFLGDHV